MIIYLQMVYNLLGRKFSPSFLQQMFVKLPLGPATRTECWETILSSTFCPVRRLSWVTECVLTRCSKGAGGRAWGGLKRRVFSMSWVHPFLCSLNLTVPPAQVWSNCSNTSENLWSNLLSSSNGMERYLSSVLQEELTLAWAHPPSDQWRRWPRNSCLPAPCLRLFDYIQSCLVFPGPIHSSHLEKRSTPKESGIWDRRKPRSKNICDIRSITRKTPWRLSEEKLPSEYPPCGPYPPGLWQETVSRILEFTP